MNNSTTNTSKNPILNETTFQKTERNLRKEIYTLKETIKDKDHQIKVLERRDVRNSEQVNNLKQEIERLECSNAILSNNSNLPKEKKDQQFLDLMQENRELKERIAQQKKELGQLRKESPEVRLLKRELRETRLALKESQQEIRKLKAERNPDILKILLDENDSSKKENTELRKQIKRLSNFSLKSGTEFDPAILAGIQTDFTQKLLELFESKDEELTITQPLLSELKKGTELILEASNLIEGLDKEDQKKIEELEEKKKEVQEEKKSYDQEENQKIREYKEEIRSEIDEDTYAQLKSERSSKYQKDQQFNQEIADIKKAEAQIIEDKLAKEEQETLKAIANTISETDRKNNRSSESSSTPPSQQGLEKPNNRLPEELKKKRGAPVGHEGYRFDFDGLDLSELNEAKLNELSEKFPVDMVYLTPKDIPEDAEIRDKSTRIAFGVIKMPCILVYVQQEAVSRNPENKRQLIKKVAPYPDWLVKDYTYSPEYHTEALFQRLQLNASYGDIARYFNESYGLTVTAKTVWNWVHQAALKAEEVCDRIKQELAQSKYLGIDETGFRDEGLTKWVFATTNQDWTLFTLSDHRNFDGIVENGVLLNAAEGTVVIRDGYHIYDDERLTHLIFGRCWAHSTRTSKQIEEFEQANNESLQELKEWFKRAKRIREEALEEGESALKPEVLKELSDEFDTIVDAGLKNSDPTKILYKRVSKRLLIRSSMLKILKKKDFYLNFLQGTPPLSSPWNGSELTGRKNPKAIQDLAKIANRIDLAIAQAQRDGTAIPEKERIELKEAFFEQVERTYKEFKDSKATVNFKTLPKIVEETTQAYNFFKDLKKDRDKFLLFLTDLKADISNNNTETAIRPLKRAINVSGSFRGYANEHVSLESYISSARKQNLNLQDSLDELVNNNTSYLFDKEARSTVSKKKQNIKTKPIKKVELT